jgi:membrane associated rhomboid family serine protease
MEMKWQKCDFFSLSVNFYAWSYIKRNIRQKKKKTTYIIYYMTSWLTCNYDGMFDKYKYYNVWTEHLFP